MLFLSTAAWAGGWSPCPAEQTTHCGPEASGAGEECCPLTDRTIVPVGSAEPETLRMGRLLVGRTEVTRGEYLAVVGSGPHLWAIHPDPVEGVDRSLLPATHLSWYDAVLYANALSVAQGLAPVYVIDGDDVRARMARSGWRLPTNAEWQRAADTLGDDTDAMQRIDQMLPVCAPGTPDDRLCDLATNAWEWVNERERPDEWDPYTDAWIRGCKHYESDDLWDEQCSARAAARLPRVGFRLVRAR